MIISTEIGSVRHRLGEEKAIEAVAKAGFDAWDFSLCGDKETQPLFARNDYLARVRELKQIGLDNGIFCNQAHAPYGPGSRPYLFRAIECAAEAGAGVIVIHPEGGESVEENVEFYQELLPFAKGCGIKIAAENLFHWNYETNHPLYAACCNAESFLAHLDGVNDDFLVGCLDTGHAEMVIDGVEKSAVELIYALGDKLQALHIHDNDLRWDSHRLPFTRNIDFEAIVKALKKTNYQGEFTLECGMHIKECLKGEEDRALGEMAAVARKLADMFDAC